jgi:hypothetical protein
MKQNEYQRRESGLEDQLEPDDGWVFQLLRVKERLERLLKAE